MTTTQEVNKQKDYLPILLLLGLALVWGSSFILMKKGLIVYSYEQVGTLRIVISFVAMLFFVPKSFKKIPKKKWKYVVLMGLLGNLFPSFLFAIAVSEVESSLAGILNALTPLFTMIVGVIAFQNKLNKGQIIGLLVGLVGCIGISIVNNSGGLGNLNYYLLFVVAATVCYAFSANIIKAHLSDIPSIPLTACAMFVIGPLATGYLFSTDFIERTLTVEGAWIALGYLFILGTLGTAFGLIIFNIVIRKTSAVFATSVTYIIPIVAVMWGVLDGEQLFTLHYVGMTLIIFGVYIVNKFKK